MPLSEWLLISGELVNISSFDYIYRHEYKGNWSINFAKLAKQVDTITIGTKTEQSVAAVMRTVLSFPMANKEESDLTFYKILSCLNKE